MFRSKSKECKDKQPSGSYMDSKQFAAYLTELRDSRVSRPGGARPQPLPFSASINTHREADRLSAGVQTRLGIAWALDPSLARQKHLSDGASATQPTGPPSIPASPSSRYSTWTQKKDYVLEQTVQAAKPSDVIPTANYMERGQRWMEKEEAISLRQAIEDMDIQNEMREMEDPEERRVYEAALDEASELVWRHQNPGRLPEPEAPYAYKPHLRKNSYAYARSASACMYGDDVASTGLARDTHSVPGSSSGSDVLGSSRSRLALTTPPMVSVVRGECDPNKAQRAVSTTNGPSPAPCGHRQSSLKRNISGEAARSFSGNQIWDEAETQTAEQSKQAADRESFHSLRAKPRKPLNHVHFAADAPAPPELKLVSRTEIHRNPPSQSRNAQYTVNAGSPASPGEDDTVTRKDGPEIRSDDIRQATSMKLKDRSARLPMPSAVSDNPGRPIVSFDRNWKPPEEATDTKPEDMPAAAPIKVTIGKSRSPFDRRGRQQQWPAQQMASIVVAENGRASPPKPNYQRSMPPPTIQDNGPGPSVATMATPDDATGPNTLVMAESNDTKPRIPTIVLPDDPDNDQADSGDGQVKDGAVSPRRPLPVPSVKPRRHWSPTNAAPPSGHGTTARCNACEQPLEGRFVSLAGLAQRFHPACFRCFTCRTPLEALEISPEPQTDRAERLARITARERGEVLPEEQGKTAADDGDDSLRFYCHLDWHEQFAPRCRHCTTPILGEHVVALGHHFHFGHFFCAECGDPFGEGDTHIEKDGYAWCVSCQTKRTERRAPKCRRCRQAVIGSYVQALGAEWHDKCFRCQQCQGGFDDAQIFPVERAGGDHVVLCTACMQRELKA